MSEDKSVVQKLEAPPLAALKIKSKLAPTPASPPRYSVRVNNAAGAEVVLGDPRATRALVALMDVHAVNGGAACHWGGPAAFAEIMSAIHGIMFAVKDRPWHDALQFRQRRRPLRKWNLCPARQLWFRRHDLRGFEGLSRHPEQTDRPRRIAYQSRKAFF